MANSTTQKIAIILWLSSEDGALEKFAALRREVQETWGHLLGSEGQLWGQGIEKPTMLFWVICYRDDGAVNAFRTDPAHASFLQRCAGVGADYRSLFRLQFVRPPLPYFTTPVTAFTWYKLWDNWDPADANALMDECTSMLAARGLPGHHGYTWAVPTERGGEGVFLGGWDTVEDHMRLGENDDELTSRFEDLLKVGTRIVLVHTRMQRHTSQS